MGYTSHDLSMCRRMGEGGAPQDFPMLGGHIASYIGSSATFHLSETMRIPGQTCGKAATRQLGPALTRWRPPPWRKATTS